jgi:hypothetical protein
MLGITTYSRDNGRELHFKAYPDATMEELERVAEDLTDYSNMRGYGHEFVAEIRQPFRTEEDE